MSSPVGTLLSGRYRLDAQVGAGGMSTVFRAFDTVLERQVAIKLLHREIAADADQIERFRREARSVAQLNHPHVVGVIDAGEAEPADEPGLREPVAIPYIVFEYVEGDTLKDRIRRSRRLPVPEAVAYAIEIARALEAAHERHIVHRDVKPQNVLIDGEGTAKVTDFGIARSLTEEGLTADGRVLGTTDYVSPEQALGHDVGPQSDLYSLGVVLFEMLTGDVPFRGENQVSVAMKHVREELPDVQLRRPEVSSALAAVVDRATAKDLDRRYATDGELIEDLEDVLGIEAARSGQATGEATAVLRTLPPQARRRLPMRMLHPVRIVVLLALIGAATAVTLVIMATDRTERGTGSRNVTPAGPRARAGLARTEPRQGLRPVRRRRRARRRGQGRRRPGPPVDVVDRAVRRRHVEQQARGRRLRRRQAQRRGARHGGRLAHARVARDGLRGPERADADQARGLHPPGLAGPGGLARPRSLQLGRQALPLLPRVDHQAPARGALGGGRRDSAVPAAPELTGGLSAPANGRRGFVG